MDRFDDMRARVSINEENTGGSGGSGGSGSEGGITGGTSVVVQASDNFSVGDTFAGVKRTGGSPQIVSVALGIQPKIISANGKVAMTTEPKTSMTSIDIYIYKDGAWNIVNVELPDMSNIGQSTYGTINEDGSKIVWSFLNFLLVIDVNVESLSASTVRIELDELNTSIIPDYSGKKVLNCIKFDRLTLIGDYVIGGCTISYQYSETQVKNFHAGFFAKVGASLTNEYFWGTGAVYASYYNSSSHSGLLTKDDGNKYFFYTCGTGGMRRFELSLGKVVKINETTPALLCITQNGKYGTSGKTIYKINQETGTSSTLSTITSSASSFYAIDENIKYFIMSNSTVYMIGDLTCTNPISLNKNRPIDGSWVDLDNGLYFHSYSNYQRTMALTNEEGEYIITHTSLVPSGGDIYGVTTEAMSMGDVKKAVKLFGRTSGENATPTFIEYIQCSGTQYINTGFKANQNTKVEMEVMFANTNTTETLWCSRSGYTSNTYSCFKVSNIFRNGYNTSQTDMALTITTNQKYKVCQDKNEFYIDGVLQHTDTEATFSSPYNMLLFVSHNGGETASLSNYGKYKMYSCKIYDDGVLVRDFRPAIYLNEYCLFDKVEEKLYYNAGSGTFTGA